MREQHRETRTALYQQWLRLKARPSPPHMCELWAASYTAFKEALGSPDPDRKGWVYVTPTATTIDATTAAWRYIDLRPARRHPNCLQK